MKRNVKFSIFALIAFIAIAFEIYNLVPNNIAIIEGESYSFPNIIKDTSGNSGHLKFFGLVPYKDVQVNVIPKEKIIPMGKTIGVTINIGGVMVLGFSDIMLKNGFKACPARQAGLRSGDIIYKINGQSVKTIDDLSNITENTNSDLNIEYKRNGENFEAKVTPMVSAEDSSKKIGIWVRDKTSGIGTLTYIIPSTNSFGALGHPITDMDTDQIINVGTGNIQNSEIVGITKGERGRPGELKGIILGNEAIGTISQNNSFGIFGVAQNEQYKRSPVPIAMRNEIFEGKASIITDVEGGNSKEYSAEIIKVFKNSYDNKSMIIKITDEELINKTGGIVQGMSGCPIMQNGKLIGAVTHVLVNDPTKGYGIFIELMLTKSIGKT